MRYDFSCVKLDNASQRFEKGRNPNNVNDGRDGAHKLDKQFIENKYTQPISTSHNLVTTQFNVAAQPPIASQPLVASEPASPATQPFRLIDMNTNEPLPEDPGKYRILTDVHKRLIIVFIDMPPLNYYQDLEWYLELTHEIDAPNLWLKEEGNHTLTTTGTRLFYRGASDEVNGGDNYFFSNPESKPYMVVLLELMDEGKKEVPMALGNYVVLTTLFILTDF